MLYRLSYVRLPGVKIAHLGLKSPAGKADLQAD
jgi:hypothetical protein